MIRETVNSKSIHLERVVIMMSIEKGQKLPDFQLPDQSRTMRSMKDFAGKKDSARVLSRRIYWSMHERDVHIQGLHQNIARSSRGHKRQRPVHKQSILRNAQVTVPNPQRLHPRDYQEVQIFHDDFAGLKGYTAAKRSVFIIDEKGVVQYKWVSDDPGKEPNYNEIKGPSPLNSLTTVS